METNQRLFRQFNFFAVGFAVIFSEVQLWIMSCFDGLKK